MLISDIGNIGTHWANCWIRISGLPILIWIKNYGRHCAETSSRAIAKMLSLSADERQVSLLALINVPSPPPTVLTRSQQGQAAVASLLRGQSHRRQGNWSGHGRWFKISQVSISDVWMADASARGRRFAIILEISGLMQFTKIHGHRWMRILF